MTDSLNVSNTSFSSSGTLQFSGLSSGIDIQAAVDSIMAAKRLPAVRYETKVSQNSSKITAFNDLKTISKAFSDILDGLRGQTGFFAESVFDSKVSFTSSRVAATATPGHTASPADNILGVSVSNDADAGTHVVEVVQLAQAHQIRSGAFTSKTDTLQSQGFAIGDFNINGATITVDNDDTINDLKEKINLADVGVTASVISVTPTEHYLVMSSEDTGTANAIDLSQPAGATPPGSIPGGAVFHLSADNIDGVGGVPADGASVAVWNDISGNNRDATTSGGSPLFDADAASANGGVAFNSGADSLTIADNAAVNTSNYNQKTFAVTFETGSDVTTPQVIYEQGGGTNGYNIVVKDGRIYAAAWTEGTWGSSVLDLGAAVPGTTYSVGMVHDALAGGGGTLTGYVNGNQVAQNTGAGQMAAHSGDVGIGAIVNATIDPTSPALDVASGWEFTGNISEVISYNTALTGGQMQDIANYDINNWGVSPTNGVLESLGLTSGGNVANQLTTAQDAIIRADNLGVDIVRDSNTIDDVFTGVTIDLFSAEAGTEVVIDIENNLADVKQSLVDFVDAYNLLKDFIDDQRSQVVREEDGEPEYGALAFDQTLRSISQELAQVIGASVPGQADGFASLGQIGITMNNEFRLEIDDGVLDNKLLTGLDDVQRLFEFQSTVSDSRVSVTGFNSNTVAGTYYLSIGGTDAAGDVTSANIGTVQGAGAGGADDGTVDLNGLFINPNNMTGADGLNFAFNAGASTPGVDDVEVTISRGLADRLFSLIDRVGRPVTGTIDQNIQELTGQNEELENRVTQIDQRLEITRASLTARFIAMEQAVAQSNSLLDSLSALNQQNNDN